MYRERGLNFTNVIISDQGLTVTYSDGHPSRWPSKTRPVPDPENGDVIYYRPIASEESKTDLYLVKAGGALAKAIEETSSLTVPKRSSISRFRSPHEFEEHLIWMASDKTSRCICKYCSPFGYEPSPRRQNNINSSNTNSINSHGNATSGSSGRSLASRIVTVSERNSISPVVTRGPVFESKSSSSNNEDIKLFDNVNNRFRRGEVVWVDIDYFLTPVQRRQLVIQVGDDRIKYWPAAVVNHKKAPYVNDPSVRISQESITLYHLQVLMIGDITDLRQKAILPWHNLDPHGIIRDFDELKYTARDELVVKFIEAVNNAMRAAMTYTPLIKDDSPASVVSSAANESERKYHQRLKSFSHYKAMLFGPEFFKKHDFIRIKRSDERDSRVKEEQPIFRIKRIYKDDKKHFKMMGDIYIKMPKDDGGVKLVKMNDNDPDYNIDIAQIAGRFYTLYPNTVCNTKVKEQIDLHDRVSILKKEHSSSLEIQRQQTANRAIPFDDNSALQINEESTDHYGLMDALPIIVKEEETEDMKFLTSLIAVKEENNDDMMDIN
ncbi:10410_t:CDS:2 [Acaulospora colombiana]|uniref:10410_t:CDS:1 n=1 Tax=Acaulospora colombiana TaxID=27376 RepID=A0ACA9L6I7_9GLOM|nr:10410_t:CDS:2 [Acaulospora colombiana]